MSFLLFFDLVSFDEKGSVNASSTNDINHSRSNFLYLISKYNTYFLKEDKLQIPDFFKDRLAEVLRDVEQGGSFEKARKEVLKNCHPRVQMFANNSSSDREFISRLNSAVPVRDKDFSSSVKKVENDKHLAYILTALSGGLFQKISTTITKSDWNSNIKEKSALFKDVIKYNSLVDTASKVQDHSITTSDIERLVG